MLPLITIFAATAWHDPSAFCKPIDLDLITVDDARELQNFPVKSTFFVTSPPDTHDTFTVVGTGFGAVERTAFIPKDLLVDRGDEVTIFGRLRVIDHPGCWVNQVWVRPWTEIRVSPAGRAKSKDNE